MKQPLMSAVSISTTIGSMIFATIAIGQQLPILHHRIYETYPSNIGRSIASHSDKVTKAGVHVFVVPYYFIVPSHRRWKVGQEIKVAFSGGDDELYAKIEKAAEAWTQPGVANLKFVFKDINGQYLHWSSSDKERSAQIRIAFSSGRQFGGYWSLVGTDSIDNTIEGGAPNQASMNFDSFDKALPEDWDSIVRHEFGHALGFQHEHQSPVNGCDFRFKDDPGYVKTKDEDGWYSVDKRGRYPGLYTYMGGKANYWPRKMVDSNLRKLPTTSAFLVGPFDKFSIMKYYYTAFMFKTGEKSPCVTLVENEFLSPQDIAGVQKAYPSDPKAADRVSEQTTNTLKQLSAAPGISAILKKSINQRLIENQRP